MPGIAILTGTALVPAGSFPYSIVIGGVEVAPTRAALESVEFQDNGDDEPGDFSARLWDPTNTLTILERAVVYVQENASNQQVFLGRVTKRAYEPTATGRWIDVAAKSISRMLDEVLVVREKRPIESDRARVLYLWGKYARWPLSGDPVFVTQTNASIAADDLINLTLRQALRQTAGLAGSTVRLAVDPLGKLHWFAGTESNPAPFNINVALSPGGGNIAPDDLRVERDVTIVNRVYVRGANAAGSGFYQDDVSVATYGPVENFLDAPTADTAAKAQSLARLYLGRVANPRTRATFNTEEPNDGWRAGQNVTVTDAQNDLSAASLRLARVTMRFTKGTGTKRYAVELGSVRGRDSDFATSLGASASLPAQVSTGTLFDSGGNALISTLPDATTAFGPAVRRFIQSGVFNGDFALTPAAAGSEIGSSNPLPYWTYNEPSGTATKATSRADSTAASGFVIDFRMLSGAAGDEGYLEQIVPVNGSQGRSFAYSAVATLVTDAVVNGIEVYCTVQFLKADAITTTGGASTSAQTTAAIGASTLKDLAPLIGAVPANAYYLRVRFGIRRAAAATTDSVSVKFTEIRVRSGGDVSLIAEGSTPTTYGPTSLYQSGGNTFLAINQGGAGGISPYLSLRGSVAAGGDVLVLNDAQVERDLYAERGKLVGAYPIGGGPLQTPTTARNLPVSGGAVQIPIVVPARMTFQTLTIRSTDAASLRTAEWGLYDDRDVATATRLASGTYSFTPGAASNQDSSAGSVLVPPGMWYLVIRNTSATQTFGLGEQAGGTMAPTTEKTQTLGSALGATLNLVTGWSSITAISGVILRGTQAGDTGYY